MRNPLKRMKDYYVRDIKFKYKLLISHLIIVLIPTILIAYLFYSQIYGMIVDSAINAEKTLALQGGESLEKEISQIEYVSNMLGNYQSINQILSGDAGYQAVIDKIDQNMVQDICIYYDAEHYPMVKKTTGWNEQVFQEIDKISSTYWYGIFETRQIEDLYCPSLYLSPSEVENRGKMAYIRRISTGGNPSKTVAYIAVYFDSDNIEDTLKKNVTIEAATSYVVNSRSVLVLASDESAAGVYFMKPDDLIAEIGEANKFVTGTFVGSDVYIGYQKIASTDWYLVSAIPAMEVTRKGQKLVIQFGILYLIVLALAFVLAIMLSSSIEKRLKEIGKKMKTMKYGSPQKISDSQITKDEIGQMADTYNYMTVKLNDLLAEKEQAAKDMQKSEFKALQAQINPHFLYNSLDMINWLTKRGETEEASKAVQALSKFYKLTLSNKDAISTIGSELEHVSLYVKLQNMRFDDAIELVIDIPQEMLQCSIPRLTFQPIVENSIQHGIQMKEDKSGTIVITGWIEEEAMVFLVSDDGVGMPSERLEQVLCGQGKSTKGSNIGVFNTHQRLRLFYGEKAGLHYESKVGVGTEVTIRIPNQGEG